MVRVINKSLGKGEDSLPFIGVLDIFGKEPAVPFIPPPRYTFSVILQTRLKISCISLSIGLLLDHYHVALLADVFVCIFCGSAVCLCLCVCFLLRVPVRDTYFSAIWSTYLLGTSIRLSTFLRDV